MATKSRAVHVSLVEDLGEDFDETVLKWKEVAEGRMKYIEVVNE